MLNFAVVQHLWVDRPWHPMLWRTLVHRLLDKTQEGKLLHKRKLIFHVLWPPEDRNESITVFIGFHFFNFFGVAFYTLLAFLSIDSEIARTEPKYGHCDATCNNVIKPVKKTSAKSSLITFMGGMNQHQVPSYSRFMAATVSQSRIMPRQRPLGTSMVSTRPAQVLHGPGLWHWSCLVGRGCGFAVLQNNAFKWWERW